MIRVDCAVIGAGLAGAATAYRLCRAGLRRIAVIDSERVPGFHSSSRNAAMVRQLLPDDALRPLALAGAAFIREAHEHWGGPSLFDGRGSLFSGDEVQWSGLLAAARAERPRGVAFEVWSRTRLEESVAATKGSRIQQALYCPSDGVADVHGLLQGFLREVRREGGQLLLGAPVRRIAVDEQRRVTGLEAGPHEISTPCVVNAAGAWAGRVAALAGAAPLPVLPLRRHLFYTGPCGVGDAAAPYDPTWPPLWDLACDLYFRPESEGLLLCPCDEDPSLPCEPSEDPAALELLAVKLRDHFPALAALPVARSWAGLRSFAPDRRFVLGRDSRVAGFFWAAGLGGHGVTTSPAIGERVAADLLARETVIPPALAPHRFERSAPGPRPLVPAEPS